MKDVLGQAIYDYHYRLSPSKLYIHNKFGLPDVMPTETYFREEEDMPLINDENENNLENLTDDESEGNLLYTHRLQQMKYWTRNSEEKDIIPDDELSVRTQVPSIRASDR